MYSRSRTLMLTAGLAMLSACASSDVSNDTKLSDPGDLDTLGDTTVGELLGRLGNQYEDVRPIFECIEASGEVELRKGDDYSDEEYEQDLPVKNGLSAGGRQCAQEYESDYASKVLAACVVADCGRSQPNGCTAILPFLRNMAVIFDAAYACADVD